MYKLESLIKESCGTEGDTERRHLMECAITQFVKRLIPGPGETMEIEGYDRRVLVVQWEKSNVQPGTQAPAPAPEPVAVRYDFDGYGWKYIDNGSGSDWMTRHPDGELLYDGPAPAVGPDVERLTIERDTAQARLKLLGEKVHTFLNAAAGEGFVLDKVDAADLYVELFPERYAAALAQIDTGAGEFQPPVQPLGNDKSDA